MDQVVKASASVHISYTLNKLEERRLQRVPKFAVMQMLAVHAGFMGMFVDNGNVCG